MSNGCSCREWPIGWTDIEHPFVPGIGRIEHLFDSDRFPFFAAQVGAGTTGMFHVKHVSHLRGSGGGWEVCRLSLCSDVWFVRLAGRTRCVNGHAVSTADLGFGARGLAAGFVM